MDPTRAAGLARLKDFVPQAGAYARLRNFDLPGHPHVSRLSPWVRHRLVTEDEVVAAVLARYAPSTAEKFLQEVYWRIYWKGWLEMRPAVWLYYRAEVRRALDRLQTEGGLRAGWEAACRGETGIDAFDHWARELTETGYLHNHARMWFASIWCFTLRLPWALGADFFLRHLLDGDPASNTLGWRWVAGIQTPGKTYLARASNIAQYTEFRFRPEGLAGQAAPLEAPPNPPAGPPPASDSVDPGLRTGLVLHEDDLSPGFVLDRVPAPEAIAVISGVEGRSPLAVSPRVLGFTEGAIADGLARLGAIAPVSRPADLVAWAREAGVEQVVTPWAPVGPVRDRLEAARAAGLPLRMILRASDAAAWPHATKGFFKFKERIPTLVERLQQRDLFAG